MVLNRLRTIYKVLLYMYKVCMRTTVIKWHLVYFYLLRLYLGTYYFEC